jgi:DNA-binding IclR family transcriptional regulator
VIRGPSLPGSGRALSDVAHDAGLSRASARRFLLTLELGHVRSDDRRIEGDLAAGRVP